MSWQYDYFLISFSVSLVTSLICFAASQERRNVCQWFILHLVATDAVAVYYNNTSISIYILCFMYFCSFSAAGYLAKDCEKQWTKRVSSVFLGICAPFSLLMGAEWLFFGQHVLINSQTIIFCTINLCVTAIILLGDIKIGHNRVSNSADNAGDDSAGHLMARQQPMDKAA